MSTRPLPIPLRGGPFTTAEAAAAGVGRGVLAGPVVRRLFPGVYVARGTGITDDLVVRAALRVLPPDTLATSVTALRRYGVAVGSPAPLRFVTAHPHHVRRPQFVVTRVGTLPCRRGVLVSPGPAFFAAAPHLNLLELVTAGDWLVRLRLATPTDLVAEATATGGRGAVRARRAARLVRERVDSPPETALRLCLVLAGLPEPECNVVLGDATHLIGRVDLYLAAYAIILEYEGDQHRTDTGQWNLDITRQEEFASAGYCLIRVTAERMRHPRQVVMGVYRALQAAGYSGPEPAFSPEWLTLFTSVR